MYLGFLELALPALRAGLVLSGAWWLVWGVRSGLPATADLITGPVLALVALSAYRVVDRRPWEEFGLRFSRDAERTFHWSLLPVLVTYILFLGVARLLGLEFAPAGSPGLLPVLKQAGTISLTVLGLEFFFRGYLFRTMDLYGLRVALMLSGLMYGMAQPVLFPPLPLSPLTLAQATVAGVLFGFLFYRTGSLWPSVLLHALFRMPEGLLPAAPSSAALTWFALAVQLASLLLLQRVLRVRPEEQQPIIE